MEVDYSQMTSDLIKQHENDLYLPLINASQLDWMPKKK